MTKTFLRAATVARLPQDRQRIPNVIDLCAAPELERAARYARDLRSTIKHRRVHVESDLHTHVDAGFSVILLIATMLQRCRFQVETLGSWRLAMVVWSLTASAVKLQHPYNQTSDSGAFLLFILIHREGFSLCERSDVR